MALHRLAPSQIVGRAIPASGPRAHPVRWCEQIKPLAPERGQARMIRNVNASARGSDHTSVSRQTLYSALNGHGALRFESSDRHAGRILR